MAESSRNAAQPVRKANKAAARGTELFCTSEEANTELGQPVELVLFYPLITRDRVLSGNTVFPQFQELDLKNKETTQPNDLHLAVNFKHL